MLVPKDRGFGDSWIEGWFSSVMVLKVTRVTVEPACAHDRDHVSRLRDGDLEDVMLQEATEKPAVLQQAAGRGRVPVFQIIIFAKVDDLISVFRRELPQEVHTLGRQSVAKAGLRRNCHADRWPLSSGCFCYVSGC